MRLLYLTFNMSGDDTARSAREWMAQSKQPGTVPRQWRDFVNGTIANSPDALDSYDVIAVALQEVQRKDGFGEFVGELLKEVDADYIGTVAKNKSLARFTGQSFDQHLYLFYRKNSGLSVVARGSTCFGKGKTCVKGSVGMHLHSNAGHYIFICSHFPFVSADESGNAARNAAYQQTMDKLVKRLLGKVKSEDAFIVFGGDLNYRSFKLRGRETALFRGGSSNVTQLAAKFRANSLPASQLFIDSLSVQRSTGRSQAFPVNTWLECNQRPNDVGALFAPTYEPTCKMLSERSARKRNAQPADLAESRQSGKKSGYEDFEARTPSWCDRVFYNAADVRCRAGKFAAGSVESDHDAVWSELITSQRTAMAMPTDFILEVHDFM